MWQVIIHVTFVFSALMLWRGRIAPWSKPPKPAARRRASAALVIANRY